MKENIETKDVQRTEYLDKNGLDMLWAKVKENTHNQVEVERNRAVAKENSIIDTKADKSALDNYVLSTTLAEYAKKTDIPEIDTSDFISKTATDLQIINCPLAFTNKVVIASDMEDENTDYVTLEPTELQFSENNYTSSIELNGKDTDRNAECSIQINASHGNSFIRLYSGITGNENDENVLEITNSGISISNSQNENIGPDKVFATNGSVADLAQYVKKSEITTGGNVDDVQVNGVSVVENKIANIKPATKESLGVVKVGDGLNVADGTISVDSTAIGAGNYIPYARYERGEYIMLNNIRVEGDGTGNALNSSIGHNGLSVYKMLNNGIHSNIQCAEIELQSDKNRVRINDDGIDIWKLDVHAELGISYNLLSLSKRGIRLYGGDDNHVLTSNASTIDITQYVLKSAYDEKIAALEARIAALEAKHAEAAA